MADTLDCRSVEGEAVMTVDALIVLMRQVSRLDLTLPQVREALKDLYDDKATDTVMAAKYDHIRRGEIAAGRNRHTRSRGEQMWCAGPFRFRQDAATPDLAIYTLAALKSTAAKENGAR